MPLYWFIGVFSGEPVPCRLRNWYRAEILDAAREDVTLIVDCHSFPSDLAPDVDICIGFNEDVSKPEDSILELVAQAFRDAGYSVAFNRPYANSIAPAGYIGHSLMIEVSKRTYLDESVLKKGDGFEKLRATVEKVYHELLWMREHRPTCFAGPRGYSFGKSAADRRAGWEAIKLANVRFTAERYGIPLPGDLSDTAAIDKLRCAMENSWGGPSWLRSSAWMKLANEMLRTVFARVDVKLPHDAFVQHYMGWRRMPESWQERFRKCL